jgi:hypothetical protein
MTAAVPGEHGGDCAAGDVEEAPQIHPGDRVVIFVGVIGERLGDEDPSVIDQGVDPAKPRQRLLGDAGAGPGSAKSPGTVRISGSSEAVIEREFATTA